MFPGLDIPKTFGALLIGALSASVFQSISGIADLQGMYYFKAYRQDPIRIKLLVAMVCILDNVHTGFIWGAVWVYLIDNYGEPEKLDHIPWSIAMIVFQTGLVTVFVDSFFAHRIFMLSKRNWFMTVPVVVLVALRLVLAAVTAAKMLQLQSLALIEIHASWLFTLALAISTALDIVTASLLVYLLLMHRTENGRFSDMIEYAEQYPLRPVAWFRLHGYSPDYKFVLVRELAVSGQEDANMRVKRERGWGFTRTSPASRDRLAYMPRLEVQLTGPKRGGPEQRSTLRTIDHPPLQNSPPLQKSAPPTPI
ncbi:hypothetical protein FB451DRAFT_1489996 [Mycena latifolia]|nr:hypothetical protein FB451DRAFT_1489996 [Mycena latifolia]